MVGSIDCVGVARPFRAWMIVGDSLSQGCAPLRPGLSWRAASRLRDSGGMAWPVSLRHSPTSGEDEGGCYGEGGGAGGVQMISDDFGRASFRRLTPWAVTRVPVKLIVTGFFSAARCASPASVIGAPVRSKSRNSGNFRRRGRSRR
jgi:hypothetical protein